MTRPLHFVVPGRLDQRTGGYLYDARMVAGLRERGRRVTVHELAGRFPTADAEAGRAFRRTLGAIADDAVVIIDGLAMGGLPEVVAEHSRRLRIIALVHHPLADETGLTEGSRDRFVALERAALAAVRGVVVTSAFTRRRLEKFGVDERRVRSVEPGTDPAAGAEGPAEGEPPLLLCVGSVTPRKGHDVLVRALAPLLDRPWHCWCAGSLDRDPAFVDLVRSEVTGRGLGDRLSLLGELSRDALDAAYRRASIFVLPSWYEGYGMALTEALARGLPIVSTTGGAIPHTVSGPAASLVAPGDVGGMSERLRAWLDDPAARARAAKAAREAAGALPRWPEQIDAFRAAVEELSTGV